MKLACAVALLLLTGCVTKARYNLDRDRAFYIGAMTAQDQCMDKIAEQYRFLFGDRLEKKQKMKPVHKDIPTKKQPKPLPTK